MAAPVADVIVLSDSSDLEGHLLRMNNCHLLVSYCSLNKEHHKLINLEIEIVSQPPPPFVIT